MSTKVRALFSIALVDHIARCLGRTGRLSTTIGNNQAGGSALLFSFPFASLFCHYFHFKGYSICQKIWKTQQWPQDWKRSVFIPIPKKGNAKECSNYRTIALISHASKVMLKILQAKLQQYMNHELPDAQAGFRRGRGTRDQIANIRWIMEEAREFQKNISFCLIDYAKAFVWITINCGKFKRWEYQTT